jgi:glucose/arabinose dehydrogenase
MANLKPMIPASLCVLALVSCHSTPTAVELPPEGSGTLHLISVAGSYNNPLYVTAPPSDTARLFVVEQAGTIRIVQHGQLLPTAFMDITGRVGSGGERGLLSMAFHPHYATNGFFYVNYTDLNGDTHVERFSVSAADSNVADTSSHKLILFVKQPYPNHNGGLVLFGPDGMLYIGMGDGGSGGDPQNRAQDPDSVLGRLLRIDVDGGDPYAIPNGNPYKGSGGAPEVWALGLRNPWRFSFDPPSGQLYIADVGEVSWEEVDVEPASQPGLNYGWRIMEGAHCFNPVPCSFAGLIFPRVEYSHADGCAVIGGYVYRGTLSPGLVGQYFYSDLCAGWLRSFTFSNNVVTSRTLWTPDIGLGSPRSFGQDARGEIYVVDGGAGTVYRIVQ